MGPRPDVPAELRGSSVEERIAGRNNIGRSHHDVYRVDRCWNLSQDGRVGPPCAACCVVGKGTGGGGESRETLGASNAPSCVTENPRESNSRIPRAFHGRTDALFPNGEFLWKLAV